MSITEGDENWHEKLISRIALATGSATERVRRMVSKEAYLTDALLHVQLGNPDRVIIHGDVD